jgi:hypothetical protein
VRRPRSWRGRLEGWPRARSCLWPSFLSQQPLPLRHRQPANERVRTTDQEKGLAMYTKSKIPPSPRLRATDGESGLHRNIETRVRLAGADPNSLALREFVRTETPHELRDAASLAPHPESRWSKAENASIARALLGAGQPPKISGRLPCDRVHNTPHCTDSSFGRTTWPRRAPARRTDDFPPKLERTGCAGARPDYTRN